MRYFYGASDEKFVKGKAGLDGRGQRSPLSTYQFELHAFLTGKTAFDREDVPIQFRATPDTLLVLAARVVDQLPLPSVYTWKNVDVCEWLRGYGYSKYQNTFRKNLIHGRSLLLVDANALSAMNIKNFDDIKHLVHGIRGLFHFELAKFARSISLPSHYYNELYKIFRVKSGRKFELTRRSDLYRRMQLIREFPKNLSHWEKLEKFLALEPDPQYPELFGGFRRKNLYKCSGRKLQTPPHEQQSPCDCVPPCECYWTPKSTVPPWKLSCLTPDGKWDAQFTENCECMPPCTCRWTSKKFTSSDKVLTCLQQKFPEKYGLLGLNRSYTSSRQIKGIGRLYSLNR